ncbi:MFS transporter [Bacteroidia bacterium]|nr:MFS transporter [Bacteroidia bacterium]
MEQIKTSLRDSRWGRWIALCLVSFTMLCSYYLTDAMAPLQERLEIALSWGATDYGIYTGGYGWFNVFLFMLIIAGMILDKLGIRFTGILAIIIMLLGAGIKYWAISGHVGGELVNVHIFNWELFSASKQALIAGLGFAVFGVGCEMFGITANKAVIRWFKGKEMAMAIGLNTSTGRIGTALAMFTPVPLVKLTGNISAPVILAMFLLCVGLLAFIAFIMYDKKLDKEESVKNNSVAEDEKFRLSDIIKIAKVRAFWYITILCVLFYSAVFPFIKYATNLIVQKFGISDEFAGYIPALLPLAALFLTPFFGGLYDRKGKGATIMVIGSVILLGVHLLFSVPSLNSLYIAIALVMLLGVGFSLVPSAMWPSIAKIIPEKRLGTAYSITFWVQNWGLMGVPMLIGYLLDKYCITGTIEKVIDGNTITVTQYNYTLPMLVFACFGALSIFFALLLKRENAKKGYGLQEPNIQ